MLADPTSASLEGQYKAPWLSMVGQAKQKEMDGVIHNSIMGVGLLPANSSTPIWSRGPRPNKAEAVNIIGQVPEDLLYMLLPLWPGGTGPASTRYGPAEAPRYDILLEDC
jgi:hypothetical protein